MVQDNQAQPGKQAPGVGLTGVERTLILGYGNLDRQDDGVAWHVLVELAKRAGHPGPFDPGDGILVEQAADAPDCLDLMFLLQLTPELAETISKYHRVCFVDAHTGAVPEEVHFSELSHQYQRSPFTHHMTPSTCLAICDTLYGVTLQAVLISIRGYEFGFTSQLSERTQALLPGAVEKVWQWLHSDHKFVDGSRVD